MNLARGLVFLVAVLAPRSTPAAAAPPADVLAEVSASIGTAEIARWERAIGALIPGVTLPTPDQVTSTLARMVGAHSLVGLDLSKPVRLVLLDPKRYPNPAI